MLIATRDVGCCLINLFRFFQIVSSKLQDKDYAESDKGLDVKSMEEESVVVEPQGRNQKVRENLQQKIDELVEKLIDVSEVQFSEIIIFLELQYSPTPVERLINYQEFILVKLNIKIL